MLLMDFKASIFHSSVHNAFICLKTFTAISSLDLKKMKSIVTERSLTLTDVEWACVCVSAFKQVSLPIVELLSTCASAITLLCFP